MTEVLVRDALRAHVMSSVDGAMATLDELWVPRSHERADIAVIGATFDGFEIKTERDTLKRLPRQAVGYGRLFDRCTTVVAERHRAGAEQILPDWWGVIVAHVDGDQVSFTHAREPGENTTPDPEFLVRLLWRDEVVGALLALGETPQRTASRGALWRDLLRLASLAQLRAAVRDALLHRDHSQAKLPTSRRIMEPALALGR